jgi:hypothetical protein
MGRAEQITELEQSIAEANLTIQSQQETLQEYQKTMASFPGVKADYDAKVKQMTQAHEKEMSDLKNLLKTTETSVNRRVIEALASIGVNQFAPEEILSVQGPNPNDLYQKFLSLKGAEQTEFYKKHEQAISKFVHAK